MSNYFKYATEKAYSYLGKVEQDAVFTASDNLHDAYNYFKTSYSTIKNDGTWHGGANTSAISVCDSLLKYFEIIGSQFVKLENSVNAYMTLQAIAADIAKFKYEQAKDSSNVSINTLSTLQNCYNSNLTKYNSYISNFAKYSITVSGYSSTTTQSHFADGVLLKVDFSIIENILENLDKCLLSLTELSNECTEVVAGAQKKSVGMAYAQYYNCVTFSKNNLSIIKSNINSLKSELRTFKSRISSFVQRISNFENKELSVNLQEIVDRSISYNSESSSSEESASSSSGSESSVFDDVEDAIVSDSIDSKDYEMNGISVMPTYDEVGATNWSVDCEQADLNELANPVDTGDKMKITALTSKAVVDNDVYDEDTYICTPGGSYETKYGTHYGTDFSTNRTTIPVSTIMSGVVVDKYSSSSGGNTIAILSEVDNGDGTVSYYVTKYMHLSSYEANTGDIVSAGDEIAISGKSGSKQNGYHLHVESYKLNINADDMEECDSASDVINVYNNNKSKIVENSYVPLGSHYYNTGQATLPESSKYRVMQ